MISNGSASMPGGTIKFEVNRPFYAFSIYEDYPLFINKVTTPTID